MNSTDIHNVPMKVLCVEDSPQDAEMIRNVLIDAGYDLSIDSTGTEKEFIALLCSSSYDVILSDFRLPGINVFDALQIAAGICPDVPFICVSGSIGEETAIELIKKGAADYVLKDRLVRLSSAIKRALDEVKEKASRRRAEAALCESEKLYRSVFTNMINAFAYCRMVFKQGRPWDFIILTANNAFEQQSGLKNVAGRKISEIIPSIREKDPQLFEVYGRVVTTGVPERFEMFLESMQMWFLVSVYSPAAEHFVIVFDAITERKKAEAAIMEKMDELERFHNVTVGRELTMIELKKEVNELLKNSGRKEKYTIVE